MSKNTTNEDLVFDEIEDQDEVVTVEYDITSYPSDYTLKGLTDIFKSGDITIPNFQRGFVWTLKQASLLIESFLIGLPVPPIFLYINDENKNLVIDGQQRLMSIVYFFEGYFGPENAVGKRQVFKLSGLGKDNKYYNMRFVDLEDKDKRKLEMSVLRAINIRQLAPKDESTCVYHIFERLNTGGTPLKPQEIRNCVFRSDFLKQLQILNLNKYWRNIIGKPNPIKNQTDVELILRAYGLTKYLAQYEKPMKEFLNKVACWNMGTSSHQLEIFVRKFEKTTAYIDANLRAKPFNVRGPFNTSQFDSVFCTILNNIDSVPKDLPNLYERMLTEEKYIELTTLATTDEKVLKERFAFVKQYLFSDALQD